MEMKGNGNFERIVREIWENLRENLTSREILEKWKCDEKWTSSKNCPAAAPRLPCTVFVVWCEMTGLFQRSLNLSSFSDMNQQDCLRQISAFLVFLTWSDRI